MAVPRESTAGANDNATGRAHLLDARVVALIRNLNNDEWRTVSRLIKPNRSLRGRLTNVLGQDPVPPVLRQAVRNQHKAMAIGMTAAEAVHDDLSRRLSLARGSTLTLRALVEAVLDSDATHGTRLTALWLAGYAAIRPTGGEAVLLDAALTADTPWAVPQMAADVGVPDESPMVDDITLAVTDRRLEAHDHPGWDAPVSEWVAAFTDSAAGRAVTSATRPLLEWLFGPNPTDGSIMDVSEFNERIPARDRGIDDDLPELPAWPGPQPIDLDDPEGLTDRIEALWDSAVEALDRMNERMSTARAPDVADVTAVWRFAVAYEQLSAAVDVTADAEPSLQELASAFLDGQDELTLLQRLAALEADASAERFAADLRAAAQHALASGEHADPLTAFADLLTRQPRPEFAEFAVLVEQLPQRLHGAILSATAGVLRLPEDPGLTVDLDGPEATTGETPTDERADQTPAVGAETPEPGETGTDTISNDADTPPPGTDASRDVTQPVNSSGIPHGRGGPAGALAEPAVHEAGTASPPPFAPDSDLVGDLEHVEGNPVPLAPQPVVIDPIDPVVDAGAPDPTADDADASVDAAVVTDLLSRTLRAADEPLEHRAAAGYWIVRATDGDARQQTALETVTYAIAMRRDGGPAGTAFDRSATRLSADALTDDRTARILALAAGLRATLVAPYTARSFLDAIAHRYDSQPCLRSIVDAVLNAALSGVQVGAAAPADFHADGSDADDRITDITRRAAELLDVGPSRNLGYAPASRVWQMWIDRDHGWLGRLLAAVANDDRARAGDIATELAAIDDDELLDRITATDRAERGHKATGIEFHGRDTLVRRTHAHLDLIHDWLDAVDSQQTSERVKVDYADRVIVDLRNTIADRRAGALAELADTGADELAAAAAALAGDVLTDLFDRLAEGRAYTGREPDPVERWLARPLLRTDIALDTDAWEPAEPLDLDRLTDLPQPPTFPHAFARRLDRFDLDEAAAIVELASGDGVGTDETLQRQLHEATIAAQERAIELSDQARTDLTVAKREGFLGADAATVYDQRLAELDLRTGDDGSDKSGPRPGIDVGRVLRRLNQLRRDIDTSRHEQIVARERDARTLAANEPNVAAVLDDVVRLIRCGQLVAAEERINQAVAGIEPPAPVVPVWDGGQLSRLYGAPVEIDRALVEAIRDSGTWNGLEFSRLEEHVRNRTVHAVTSWLALAARTADSTQVVASVLGALGLDLPAGAVSIPGRRTAGRHTWFDVNGVAARGAPVPQFGSLTHGHFQVLTTPRGTSPEQALQVLDEEGRPGAIILVHLGAWSPEQRRTLADGLRARHLADVMPVDAVIFAVRLAAAEGTWRTTCELALPMGAANPYIIDTPGRLLPPEMFFGRTEEVRALLTPTGPSIVFGGRQLGKTALLKQVAVRHGAHGDDTVSVYLDIKTIGQNNDTHPVWTKIRNELERAGVPMPDARRRDPEETVTASVHAWLDAEPRRRMVILLDEADHFLAADRDDKFAQVHKLKTLMDSTDRRCKVIFAGLHQVGRFQRDPNHPFAHLGRPIGVGGLDPQDAYDLLARPLAALGYVPVDPDVLLRAVTYANYHPAILQRFGFHLVTRLQAAQPEGPPPWSVGHDDVQAVFDDPDFATWVGGLVDWTLQLDRRYAVLAYTMAAAEHEQRGEAVPMTVTEVMAKCAEYGADEFAQREREDEIVALLDELVHLGVLRQHRGRWQLRSRYVTRMLGSGDDILNRLGTSITEASATWQQFDPASHHRPFEGTIARIFPVTDRQVETVCSPHPSFRVLVGSEALGIGEVFDALREATAIIPTTKAYRRRLTRRGGSGSPPDASEQLHRVVVADVRNDQPSKVHRAIEQASAWASDPTIVGSVSTLVLVDAHRVDVLHDLLDEQLAGRASAVPITSLRRMDRRAIEQWARTAEADVGASQWAQALYDATGGWTMLVARAAQHTQATNQGLDVAAAAIAEQLRTPEAARELVDATGIGLLDGPARMAWQLLVDYGQVSSDDYDRELAAQLGGKLTGAEKNTIAIRERMLLELFGVIDVDDSTISPEPVLVDAWTLVNQPVLA